MNATLTIRSERTEDAASIRALHCAAFGGTAEAALVDDLRSGGTIVLSSVAEEDGQVVGHVTFSRLTVDGDSGHAPALALAPVAVLPEHQRRGIGTRLIESAHRELSARGETLVFVVGDPDYYRRFGFSADAARAFTTPYDGPHMMILALAAGVPTAGMVRYPAPFARLE